MHSGRTVTATRWMHDIDAPPFWRTQLGKPGNVDRWQIIRFEAPCTIVLDVGAAPTGIGAPGGDRSKRVNGVPALAGKTESALRPGHRPIPIPCGINWCRNC